MRQFNRTAIAVGVAQLCWMSAVFAQDTAPAAPAANSQVVTITGQRAALNSAQNIKRNSDEVVDSIVAEDIGKLPDKSITEVLQRVPGVTIDRTMSRSDPEHFSVEGSGVSIRGLTWVRSELNGRDSFSSTGGRALNFEDVPPELMAGVDVYKNPSAEQIEGGISGLVNLRTALPFDIKGQRISGSVEATYNELKKKTDPAGSFLYSNRWKTGIGEIGALVNFAKSQSATRTDAFQVDPYFPNANAEPGRTVWLPRGAGYRSVEYDRERTGTYGALQWKLDNTLKSHLTWFRSKYDMEWTENALFSSEGTPTNLRVNNGVYDANGGFLSGSIINPTDGSIEYGNNGRLATRNSSTTDIAWNIEWKPASNWTLTSDFQHVKARSQGFDSIISLGTLLPALNLDVTGNVPNLQFSPQQVSAMADRSNYFWAFTQEHMDRSVAEQKAWKGDVKYDFDHPVLRDLRVGVRLTDRDGKTINSNPNYHWVGVSQRWMMPWQIASLANLSDPRFQAPTVVNNFPNFFNGGANVPALVFPAQGLMADFPNSYSLVHSFHDQLCADIGSTTCTPWTPATFGEANPSGDNEQAEKTKALYGQLRFAFDDLRYPVDGNVGVRYVKTDSKSYGYTVFNSTFVVPPGGTTGLPVPVIASYAARQDYENSYDNWLPSLNLRMKASEQLQFRFAIGKGMARPDWDRLQAYTTLGQDVKTENVGSGATQSAIVTSVGHTGESVGNPMLRPTTSRNIDLTAEWYFAQAGSLTVALFDKRLKDIIVTQNSTYQLNDVNGRAVDFTVATPVNGARGTARGLELAYQQYFDKLPGWMSGFGVQLNYTHVKSKRDLYNPVFSEYCSSSSGGAANLNLNLNGCDTDGRVFGDLPLQYLSRNSYNFAALYDKGPWSARLAWSWRSKSLLGNNNNGTNGSNGVDSNPASPTFGQNVIAWGLPVWADDYGQLDGGVSYKFNENFRLDFQAQNLTDAKYKQVTTQHIGEKGRAWFVTGPRYSVRLGMTF
ncbi:TonB-dependent receptor [Massilia sp. YIM B02443]|uniref:TonB-dependent receptor n=1 Tax=Massilia sp. YIM B02443 TaxID=3050127 RepID=UPI0025B71C46|nr:TonB-dependent receptor [Massilia sp. YIM B02443]MDN4038523.1 TonB-dependent receptor [Massilia sp. YIM B02443]